MTIGSSIREFICDLFVMWYNSRQQQSFNVFTGCIQRVVISKLREGSMRKGHKEE
jgi:hypothetical protein